MVLWSESLCLPLKFICQDPHCQADGIWRKRLWEVTRRSRDVARGALDQATLSGPSAFSKTVS